MFLPCIFRIAVGRVEYFDKPTSNRISSSPLRIRFSRKIPYECIADCAVQSSPEVNMQDEVVHPATRVN